MSAFTGLSAFPITPCDAAGRVDEDHLRRLLAPLVEAGVDSIGLLGSTGTYAYLPGRSAAAPSPSPPRRWLAECRCWWDRGFAHRRGRAPRGGRQGAGCDGGAAAPVSYTPLTEDEVFAHFAAVAAGEGGLPLVIYDNPATTRISASRRLCSVASPAPGGGRRQMPRPHRRTPPRR